MAEAALRLELLDQMFERNVLMVVGVQAGLPHLLQQLGEAGFGVDLGAQHQGIDEKADQPLAVAVGATGDGAADQDVILAAVAGQQHVERRQQGHEQSRPLPSHQATQVGGKFVAKDALVVRTAETLLRWARPVGGQFQQRRPTGQLARPVSALALQCVAVQPAALPRGVIAVLHGQGRAFRRPPCGKTLIRLGEIRQQHGDGPAVADDVVHIKQHDMPALAELQQADPQQRPMRQIERRDGVGVGAAADFAGLRGFRQAGQVVKRPGEGVCRQQRNARLALAQRERRAQAVVPVDQPIQAGPQRDHVQRSVQAERGRHVVGGAGSLELLDEPQPLLRERQHLRRVRRLRQQGRQHIGPAHGHHRRRQVRKPRMLEYRPHRQLDAEAVADARRQLGRQQRVSAQVEEIVVRANRLHAQHGGEHLGQQLLLRRLRRPASVSAAQFRDGQGFAIKLAVGGQRDGVQRHERGRHHVVRQAAAQGIAQFFRARQGPGGGDEVSHQPHVVGAVLAGDDRRLRHAWQRQQRRLDLAEFDAEAANLHLVVGAANEFEFAVRTPARQVASPVHARSRLAKQAGERVGDEALGGQARTAQIAPRQPRPADVKLADHANRDWLQTGVQYIGAEVGNRLADGDAGHLVAIPAGVESGVDAGFGGAVKVVNGGVRQPLAALRP